MKRKVHLDRVALDGFVVRRRSATLTWEERDPRSSSTRAAWQAYVACATLPARFQPGPEQILLDATRADGRKLSTAAIIVERRDDAHGTVLALADPASSHPRPEPKRVAS